MEAALTALLVAIYNVLQSIRDIITKPSKENEEKLVKHLLELEEANRQFEVEMNKIRKYSDDVLIANLSKDIESLESILDKNFLAVIAKVEQITKDIELFDLQELSESTELVAEKSRKILVLWQKLQGTLNSKEPKEVRKVLKWIHESTKTYVQDTIVLADCAQITLRKRQLKLRPKLRQNKKRRGTG